MVSEMLHGSKLYWEKISLRKIWFIREPALQAVLGRNSQKPGKTAQALNSLSNTGLMGINAPAAAPLVIVRRRPVYGSPH